MFHCMAAKAPFLAGSPSPTMGSSAARQAGSNSPRHAKLYPGGFTNSAETIGSVYQHTNSVSILSFTEGQLTLTNGNLAQSITNQIGVEQDMQATDQGANDQSAGKLTFKISSGLFKGSVTNPETGKPITVNGIILQNQNFGADTSSAQTRAGACSFRRRNKPCPPWWWGGDSVQPHLDRVTGSAELRPT